MTKLRKKMPKQTRTKPQKAILELVGDDQPVMFYDDLDEAIIGTAERINLGPVVAYDVEKILEIYIERDGMTYEQAQEYFDYNVIGGWNGEETPVFIRKIENNGKINEQSGTGESV